MNLTIQNLTVSYSDNPVLNNIGDRWVAGQINGIIGSNGAGKSTLLKAIAGLIPAKGTLSFCGTMIDKDTQNREIAYMAQDNGATSSLTVIEVVLLGRLNSLGLTIPESYVNEAMTHLNAFGLYHLHTRTLDALSGGQRQLVYLAQALFRNPKILLLDEPTAALDLRHQLLVLEHVRRYAQEMGAIVAVAMHDLTLAAHFSDRIIAIDAGQVIAHGKPIDVLTRDLLGQLYGVEADVSIGSSGRVHIVPTATVKRAGHAN